MLQIHRFDEDLTITSLEFRQQFDALLPWLLSRSHGAADFRMESVMKTIILGACVLALTSARAAAGPVIIEGHNSPLQEFLTEQVSFADLDISSEAGLSALKTRINVAATRVCASVNPEPLMATLESQGCYRRAVNDSYAQAERAHLRNAGAAVAAATVSVSAH